ncbi:glutamine synthetase family protein [Bullifex sp.]|uniref:glutamine synthetase family protein n=1 Tax=Bullifex sp. TaxID=2815808 RepID=UPI002A82E1DE|nr:glutamine synthetase family protein [Bullifex sp.]MDY4066451.1 glutamine synthetase family protein [Bullifex sp.]
MSNSFNAEEIISYAKEQDVSFVRLAFCDIFGQLKNISVSLSTLERAFSDGIRFDASQIRGFLNVEDSDLLLFPDPNTMAFLPWRPSQGRVIRFYCDIKHPDGRPFVGDTRYMLKQTERELFEKDYEVYLGSELEFYLFKTDENGDPTYNPMDRASYFDIAPLDKGENIRREICLTMEEMGLKFESSHHEKGPGQNEVVFRHSLLLDATDNIISFKSMVKALAARNGLYASFLPKPLFEESGSGFHMNISVSKDGRDMSVYRENVIAGILKHIREMTVFLNPIVNSYERLGGYQAPGTITYGTGNRNLLIRVPFGKGADANRIELRSPDNAANPYIAATLLTRAAMEGIENDLKYDDSLSGDSLPQSLIEAVEVATDSEFINSVLPQHLVSCFLNAKRQDWALTASSSNPRLVAREMEFSLT